MNTEHQLKSKLAWSMFEKSMKLKQKMVQKQWLATAKNDVFIFYWVDLPFDGTGKKFGGEGVNEQIFGWLGDSPIPLVGKNLYKLWQQVFIYNKKFCAHHIHHAPKWPSYFCNVWALCVSQIYMVHIFTYLFSLCNTINLSHHEHV